jgi:Putative peptidoglycan binding domain
MISRAKLTVFLAALPFAGSAVAQDSPGLPPDARPGQCYARVSVPAEYTSETQQVIKREASTRIEVQPAKYEWVEERVLIKEASKRLEIVPAKYEWVDEKVVVTPAGTRLEPVEAQYEWTEEKVLVKPAETIWKKGHGPVEKLDNSTGEIMCLVEVPAVYNTVKKRALKSPASTRQVDIPAVTKTVRKQVLKTPASTREIEIPAEYSAVRVQKLVSPAKEVKVDIPALSDTVTTRKLVRAANIEWREVLCETNTTPKTIQALQQALRAAGHDPGRVDGVIGAQTLVAVRAYQTAKGLPTGGLTMATLKALGIDPKH